MTANAQNLDIVGSYEGIGWVEHKMVLSKDDTKLFVVDFNENTDGKIQIINLSDITNPTFYKEIVCVKDPEGRILGYKITHNDQYLFVSLQTNSSNSELNKNILQIYDIQNLQNIRLINQVNFIRIGSIEITPDDKYLFISSKHKDDGSGGIEVFDIENPRKIQYLATFNSLDLKDADYFNLVISPSGKKLAYFTATPVLGLELVDISNPLQPIYLNREEKIFNRRGHLDRSALPKDLFFLDDDSKLYFAGGSVGLVVYDIKENKLKEIQKTGKYNPLILFPITGEIYSIDLHNKDTLVLVGKTRTNTIKTSTSIKGVKSAIVIDGEMLLISQDNTFIVLVRDAMINIIKM